MTKSFDSFEKMTASYTAAWNSGDASAVADHYASGKGICKTLEAPTAIKRALFNVAGHHRGPL